MTTITIYINRPFAGENPDDLELTLERLAKYTLQSQGASRRHFGQEGKLFIFGNFEEFSGAFAFLIDDVPTADRVLAAFKRNPGYQPRRYAEDL